MSGPLHQYAVTVIHYQTAPTGWIAECSQLGAVGTGPTQHAARAAVVASVAVTLEVWARCQSLTRQLGIHGVDIVEGNLAPPAQIPVVPTGHLEVHRQPLPRMAKPGQRALDSGNQWRWLLDRWLPALPEQQRLQRLLGACLSGQMSPQVVWLYGPDSTGKSTFLGILEDMWAPLSVRFTADQVEAGGYAGERAQAGGIWIYPPDCRAPDPDILSHLLHPPSGEPGIIVASGRTAQPPAPWMKPAAGRVHTIPFTLPISPGEAATFHRDVQPHLQPPYLAAAVTSWVTAGAWRHQDTKALAQAA